LNRNIFKEEKTMKKIKMLTAIKIALVSVATSAILSTPAHADLDFADVTSAVSVTTIVSAITALAALKIAPGFAKWGFNKVIGWFR
jgi:hypothetical protein